MAIANSTKLTYKASVELMFDYNGNRERFLPETISYIMIQSDYDKNVLPVIYISVAVNASQYQNIMNYKNNAKFYLSIKTYNSNIISSVSKTIVDGIFSYIPSTTNPNYFNNLNNSDQTIDNSYKRITLGLVSIDLTNKLRKSFNGIYYNIDQNTLIGLALEGTNAIVEKPLYNLEFESIFVPPIATRYKMLEYIFKRSAFYNTNFRYFMDFERSYLTSKEGNYIDDGTGDLKDIIINIGSILDNSSYFDGLDIRNGSYYLSINPQNSNVTINNAIDKVANQIVAVNVDRGTQIYNLDINPNVDSDVKQIFIRSKNGAVEKNEFEDNSIILDILKQHVDPTIFTPNKRINISNYGDYSQYNGKYILIYKREFFKGVSGEFLITCNVGLKKVGDIRAYRDTKEQEKNTAVTVGTSKHKTSSKQNTSRIASR